MNHNIQNRLQFAILQMVLISLLLLLSLVTYTDAQQKIIKWRGQRDFGAVVAPYGPFEAGYTDYHGTVQEWLNVLTKATNGQLKIDIADANSIYPSSEGLSAVGKGVVDIAITYGGYYMGKLPVAGIPSTLPLAWRNIEEEYECFYKYGLYKLISDAFAAMNVKWFPLHADSIAGLGANTPLHKPADVKGKKFRAVGLQADYIKMLGGIPVSIPLPEVYTGLKLKTVDGAVVGAVYLQTGSFQEVLKHFVYEPKITMACSDMLINMDSYKALPNSIQDFMETYNRYIIYAASTRFNRQNYWVLRHASQKYGVELTTWSENDIKILTQKVAKEIWPKVAAQSPLSAKAIDIIKQQKKEFLELE
ncbi:MAG: TRAP transporter substrate-binding protein DctP [Deltaproteobacteria bacterium]